MLFETADTHASKRKSKLLDNTNHNRIIFATSAKSPLIPTTQERPTGACDVVSLAQSFENLDTSGHNIDVAWFLCVAIMTAPMAYELLHPGFYSQAGGVPGLVYCCALVYPSLFACLPGISVHIFCIFLLVYNRCRLGFFCYIIGICMLVGAVEVHCTFGAVQWCAPVFAASVLASTCGSCMLVRAIYGAQACRALPFVAWNSTLGVLLVVGVLGQYFPLWSNRSAIMDRGLVSIAAIMGLAASWWTLLPVRIAFVQLYKA